MKNVSVVGTVGLPARYGGFESLVENLVGCKSEDIKYTVFCSSKTYSKKPNSYKGAQLKYINLSANGAQSIPYDIVSLVRCWFSKPDIVLVLGVSGCLFLPIFKFFSKSRVITNIDGLEWRRAKWGRLTRAFLKLSERFAVKYSDIVITDNQAISVYVTSEYNEPSIVIAYGGDHAIVSNRHYVTQDYFFKLCRIEPENNCHLVLEAFSKSDKKLKFVGNWDASDYGRSLKQQYSSYDNIEIINPVYDINETYKLRSQCVAYIHGHSAGGTNPSLVEAMHFSKPIFSFDCIFNRYTKSDKGYFFKDSADLLQLINQFDAKTDGTAKELEQLANERYTWNRIKEQYEFSYVVDPSKIKDLNQS